MFSNSSAVQVEPIVVDAKNLIWAGFFVVGGSALCCGFQWPDEAQAASTAADAAGYRILHVRS